MWGLNVAVRGSEAVLDAMLGRLRYFPEVALGQSDLSFDFLAADSVHRFDRPTGVGRPLGPSRDPGFQTEYFAVEDRLYASYLDRVRMLCDGARAEVQLSIAAPEMANLWIATHPMFVIALFELLKRRHCFNVHAAGVSVGGRAALLAGHSGSGKSTLALALCRGGLDFLSDDYVFLKATPAGVRVLGFPEEFDVRDETAALFPELGMALDRARRPGWTKRQIRIEDHWSVRPVWEASPVVLLFPRVGEGMTSVLAPIDARDAIAELVSNVQLTRPELAQAHLDLLGELVRRCRCYHLTTGRDFDRLPDLVRDLLAGADGTP